MKRPITGAAGRERERDAWLLVAPPLPYLFSCLSRRGGRWENFVRFPHVFNVARREEGSLPSEEGTSAGRPTISSSPRGAAPVYRVTHQDGKNLPLTESFQFKQLWGHYCCYLLPR